MDQVGFYNYCDCNSIDRVIPNKSNVIKGDDYFAQIKNVLYISEKNTSWVGCEYLVMLVGVLVLYKLDIIPSLASVGVCIFAGGRLIQIFAELVLINVAKKSIFNLELLVNISHNHNYTNKVINIYKNKINWMVRIAKILYPIGCEKLYKLGRHMNKFSSLEIDESMTHQINTITETPSLDEMHHIYISYIFDDVYNASAGGNCNPNVAQKTNENNIIIDKPKKEDETMSIIRKLERDNYKKQSGPVLYPNNITKDFVKYLGDTLIKFA